ncbi:isochorismatase hydrolase [Kribbella flavida DSM 17836]|uniref:Isochorismatase hydrolase n=1 Tax=Kribbella flavida (strain DSM 17836 / JCM 10339 / NBRC 14399) TaxID=479435 RepID=D2Q081_KRIFD|nr:isochorismatase family protein [Kribbella flavida]ADB31873.1 isochorismatase hydrolase [Kribbella flavida DSM 17836]
MPATVEPVDALLIIDIQAGHVAGEHAVPAADDLVAQAEQLLTAARDSGALVVHVQNDGETGQVDAPGTPGWELHFPPLGNGGSTEVVIRKTYDDAFRDTGLAELLAEHGVTSLAICGLMSEMCVSATARTALARDYRVVLPHDAHTTTGIPATPGIAEAVAPEVVSRVAEWALGDEIELVPHAKAVTFTNRG